MSEMTQSIIDLRRGGMGYNEIAERLGTAKHVVVYYCKKFGLTGRIAEQQPKRLDEKTVADYVDRSGFDYVGGYQMAKKPITVRCRVCGRTFERQFHVFRDVVNGTWNAQNNCPLCSQDKKDEKRAQEEQRRIEREREAQEIAKRRAEQLSLKVAKEMEKRLANHVCKNCGVEFCQASTGYNSERYCSERCQFRWTNRIRSEKRHRTLMDRKHDKDITLDRLFKRDDGICYLCGGQCDWNDGEDKNGVFVAGNNYPSIDHVVPVSKGGTHTWDNVRLAHRLCNTIKRDS